MITRDTPGISLSIICHWLHLYPTVKPVIQRKLNHGIEWSKIIEPEIDKLKDANFIVEVHYLDWLANVVLIQKKNMKWIFHVNFTNLNKAYPKDPYLLP